MNDQSRSDTRDRIVESARVLFFRQGYVATGIAQILADSNANSGSLYHYFPTKEDLLAAVLQRYKAMLEPAVLAPARERVSDPIEKIFAVLEGYRRLLQATDFALGCPIGNLALETSNSHPLIRQLVKENFEAWSLAIRGFVEEAKGRLPADADPQQLADYLLATMEGAVMLARAYHDFTPFDNAVGGARDYLERLIADGSDWAAPRIQDTKR